MTTDPLIGRQLANFRVDHILGRGGMALVYYGWDVKLQRPVAIKVIDARYQSNPAYASRFVREAQAVATWRHENIIQIYYADDQDELYYFVMEYIDGQDLASVLVRYAAAGELMPHADVLRLGRAVAGALDYAHRKGVIHRDVKPSNILIARDGRVVLGDFGLALDVHQGSFGEVVGTPHYIAPEQARRSADATPLSDLYSLGVVLYEMLTGAVPFDDPSPASVALQHLTLPPPPPRQLNPNLNADAETVLLKTLNKSPADRYPSGAALMNALEAALRAAPSPAPPPPSPPQPPLGKAPRHFSQTSLVDQVTPPRLKPALAEVKTAPPLPQRKIPWGGTLAAIAVGGVLLLIGLLAFIGIGLRESRGAAATAALITGSPASTHEAVSASATFVSPAAPSEAFTPSPEAAPTLTPILETPALAVSPTVLYPAGRRFLLFYNDNSLHLFNASGNRSPAAPLAFERLDAADQPLNRFDGWRWAEKYPFIEEAGCASLKILDSGPYLEPAQCEQYNSVRTPARAEAYIFWTAQEGSRQFRALWNDQEIARCEIAAGNCEFFLP